MNAVTYAIIAVLTVMVATKEVAVVKTQITTPFQKIACALDGAKVCVLH